MSQQQQQVVVQQPGVVQPMYVAQPAPVVESYANIQSTVIGILLIVVGALSILFNIVDIAVGTDERNARYMGGTYYGVVYQPSYYSNGVSGHGLWCGVLVSIIDVLLNVPSRYVVISVYNTSVYIQNMQWVTLSFGPYQALHRFYRTTLCISAVFAVGRCPSVRPSACLFVTLLFCIQTAEDIVTLFSAR